MTITRNTFPVQQTPKLDVDNVLEKRKKAIALLQPENDLEQLLLLQSSFLEGLYWGTPRYGHPEGKVLYHVREVLNNVDKVAPTPSLQRSRLRLISFVHDTFKSIEDRNRPRDWSKHHAALARNFLANFTDDTVTLDIIELHDEAFYAWRMLLIEKRTAAGQLRFQNLLQKIGNNLQLYYLFFKCDTRTGDKILAPLEWFETTVKSIEVVDI
ncbi:MAG: hypothetical protein AAF738_07225 [Bacteroidota bacterium]